ncbi:MAG: outer membrane protein assembly factor BamA [Candidatus Solibacter usitatus]|nr:outer membrane protein assembly factor BamA [Candidatus Solibacter usitatus]
MMFPRLSRLNDTFVWKLSVLLGVIGFLLTLQAQQPAPQTTPPPKPAPAPQQKKANPFETVRESQPATPQAQPPKPQLETPKPAAEAAKPTGPIEDVIEAIEFRGSRRVPQDTLKALIFTKKGDPLDEDTLHRDFMALWNSARFDDIQLQKEPGATGWIIRFLLTERRVIRSIKYEGNKSLTVSEILDRFKERRVGLTVESQYDPNRIQRATNVLREYLSERGRQFATVEPEIRQIPPSSLEVVFKIVEGPKVKVGNISIEGNTVFNDRVVRRAMKNLKPIGVPKSILFENLFAKAYDATKLEEDKDRVRNFYQERGYFTARALEHRTEMREVGGGKFRFPLLYMNRPGKRIDIEVAFEEGRKYHLSKINFVGVKLFRTPDTLMRPLFQMGEGDMFSTAKLRKGLENMRKLYGQFGYIDFVPEPSFDIVPNSDKLELSLTVDEGKQFFVRRIDFSGNTTTRDKVIRREILIDEGDIYNTQLWEVSVLRLNQLGYFEVLKAEEAATLTRDTKTNTVDITLKVKERGKNSVQLNGGVSGIAGSFVGFGYSTNNFLGLGETLSINSQLGDRVRDVTFGFTEPYLFDRPIQAGFTVYMQRFNYDQAREVSLLSGRNLIPLYQSLGSENLLNYVSNGGGFTAYTSYQLRKLPFGRVGVSYGYNKQHIKTLTSASTNYFEFINFQGLNGPNSLSGITTSQVIPSFSYNTVDHPITPSRGKSIYLTSIFAGSFLQGNVNMIQPTLDMKYFRHGFAKGHVIGAHFLGRFVTGYGGRAAPPFNRFYMGGENDIRGFDIWGISPIAYIPSKAEIPILNSDGSARQQKIVTNGVESFVNVTKEIPTYQLIFPGGDTQGVTNFEYRIPIVGPVVLAGFFDAGINKVLRRGQLALNPDRLRTLNDEFPQSTFAQQAIIAPGTQKLRASAGVELQIMMPVVNAPFRLYWAYNPWIFQDFLIPPIAADRSYFPNNATFINSIATIGRPSPFFEKRSQFRFTISRTF